MPLFRPPSSPGVAPSVFASRAQEIGDTARSSSGRIRSLARWWRPIRLGLLRPLRSRCSRTIAKELMRLVRYGARGAIALERLSLGEDGRLRYRMKRPAPDGSTHLVLTPVELLERLAALVPSAGAASGALPRSARAQREAAGEGGGAARGRASTGRSCSSAPSAWTFSPATCAAADARCSRPLPSLSSAQSARAPWVAQRAVAHGAGARASPAGVLGVAAWP